jgi:perosamine synthetase
MSDIVQMAEIKLTDKEINAALDVLRSGALRQGKVCDAFETAFSEKVGSKYALTCSSGTAALHLAYMACLEPGDEVLVPSFTFIATGSMVTMAGGKPIFCDIDPETWVIDLKDAERKVTERTRAIVPVHIFGNACPVDQIKSFAGRHNLHIIWDAAQAHGATHNGRDVGSFDDFVCYSFYPSKNMFTGEGGMVTLNNNDWPEKIRFLRTHGQTGKYYHTMLGLNYRMTDVEAAIGLEQLNRLDNMVAKRRKNATCLTEGLSEIPGITPQRVTSNSSHAYHQYCVLVNREQFGMDRDALSAALKKRGVMTGVHYPRGLHQQPIFEEIYGAACLPVCERVCQEILALPVHHGLSEPELEYIVTAMKDIQETRSQV